MHRRSPGRPRSEAARRAILTAATELIDEGGYGSLTIEAIAARAGVGKQTIYRWWPTKGAIVLEALNAAAQRAAPAPDTGSLNTDVSRFARRTVAAAAPRARRLLAALMAEAQLDEAFAASFRDDFLGHRRAVLREILERGHARGELAEEADLEFLTEVFFGLLWYRILTQHAPLNRRFADRLANTVLELATSPRPRPDSNLRPTA